MTEIVEIPTPFRTFSFDGGSRRDIPPHELAENQYLYLENGRVRDGGLKAINEPLDVSEGLPPGGKAQGLYQSGNLMLAFVNGRCFYKDISIVGDIFLAIQDFQMSATADRIYAEAIPASTVNFTRKSSDEENASAEIKLISYIEPSPVCVLCQDGVSRPMIIQSITNAREASDINDWHKDTNREYVPIGYQMKYYNGILYVVAANKKQLYRSVEGRPLDFVIAVDADGNRIQDLPADGIEASRMSHAVDSADITGIIAISNNEYLNARLDLQASDFFVVTTSAPRTHIVILDYDNQIYSQPTFRNRALFSAASLDQFSSVDVLGDECFIDVTGLKSFNSILSDKEDGLNSTFSKAFNFYFGGEDAQDAVDQDITAAGVSNNYAYFAVKTVYGYRVVVFDILSKVFVSLDDWGLDSPVFQFSPTKVQNRRRLFFMTEDAKVYEAFAGENPLERMFYTKEYIADSTVNTLKPTLAKVTLLNCKKGGTVNATFYVDRLKGKELPETIDAKVTDEFSAPPYGSAEEDSVETRDFGIIEARSGVVVSLKVTTTSDADIQFIETHVNVVVNKIGLEQQQKSYAS